MNRLMSLLLGLLISLSGFSQSNISEFEKNWPTWRGPYLTGVAPVGNPPISWSETENLKWKAEIPGAGHSTPIVWGNQIFVTSSVETDRKPNQAGANADGGSGMSPMQAKNLHEFVIISYDREDGAILWQKSLIEEMPQDRTHEDGSWSSNSPITDGEHVYAYFGSRGLYCLDLQGNLKWSRNFGQMEKRMSFGEGSSPAIYNDKIVILWDHEGQSALFVLDKNTGEDIWNVNRDEMTSWSTPLIVEYGGKTQIITSASNKVRSYDLETGDIIWETSGLTGNVIPQPMVEDDIVYVMSGYRGYSVMAIQLSKASGDITDTDAILWSYNRNTPYVPSPALAGGKLYFLKDNRGSLSCLDSKDGTIYYEGAALDDVGNAYPSPVAVADRLYVIGGSGVSYTVKQGEKFEILSKNVLDDNIFASPVIVGDDLYLRGFNYLYCIAE